MLIKGVKPRTHLIIDLCLFTLVVTLAITSLLSHGMADNSHTGWMLARVHEVAGIGLCLVVSLHLLLHLPWIEAQLKRLLK